MNSFFFLVSPLTCSLAPSFFVLFFFGSFFFVFCVCFSAAIYHALLHGHETTTMLLIACGAIVDEPWLNVIPSDALRTMLRKLMAAWQFNPLRTQAQPNLLLI
jgi:hypothetical protein